MRGGVAAKRKDDKPERVGHLEVELVTSPARLCDFYDGWEALADASGEPRSGASLVAAWSEHMRGEEQKLQVWVATQDDQVVGVLAMVAERLANGKTALGPPATNLVRGVVPLVRPERSAEVAFAIVARLAGSLGDVHLLRVDWLAEGSVWPDAFSAYFVDEGLVPVHVPPYQALYISTDDGVPGWLGRHRAQFRGEVRRRARRAEEAGYHFVTFSEPEAVLARLPSLQALYAHRAEGRDGGYQFDARMVAAITQAVKRARPGRFRLTSLEGNEKTIGIALSICSGPVASGWLTGFDPSSSQFGPGIGSIIAEIDACQADGQRTLDLGVGDERYKRPLADGSRFLVSCLWARPRLARLMQASDRELNIEGRNGSPRGDIRGANAEPAQAL